MPPSRRPYPPVPVLLLGGVNLVRTLGLAGIPAIVATADPGEPALASRHCREHVLLPPLSEANACGALELLGERLHARYGARLPLMYGSDDALALVHAHRERLERHFRLLLCDAEIAHALIDKDRFQRLAAARALPVPRELQWEGCGPGSVAGATGPVLAKPRTKVDWHDCALHARLFGESGKARIFASGAEALADRLVAMHREQLTFQEWIPGGDEALWSYHGVADEQGHLLASFIGRKIRTDPPLTGESAFIELAHDDSLAALGAEIAARLPLKGVFKMDLKRDPRDGRWYLLEINARYNLWNHLGAKNGVNLMEAAYRYLLEGARPQPARAGTTYRWLAFDGDRRAFRALHARGELTLRDWIASLAESRLVYNVFAWDDPGPWLRLWAVRIARRVNRGPRRVAAALRQWRSTAS